MESWRGFGSDNHAGVHPEVLSAIAEANVGHAHAYGDDPWTARAIRAVRAHVRGKASSALRARTS
jgi:threonine aldolase